MCQCPIRANHHFYNERNQQNQGTGKCQCPIRANHHFYARNHEKSAGREEGVNALYGRTIISTLETMRNLLEEKKVSMPYTGEPSFLHPGMGYRTITTTSFGVNALYGRTIISTNMKYFGFALADLCQCPIRANHHFYLFIVLWRGRKMKCVNALYGRTIISTKWPKWLWKPGMDVSMPYTGEPSFLLKKTISKVTMLFCVNALYGRTIISTMDADKARMDKIKCQCPIRANHHFYTCHFNYLLWYESCQCPIRANHHFYEDWVEDAVTDRECVNALYGRTIISTTENLYSMGSATMVSMPYTGEPSFLHWLMYFHLYNKGFVSMPYTGEPSFLRYPFRNGLFPPFFRGVFASVFQNILKTVLLGRVFVLFTVCS